MPAAIHYARIVKKKGIANSEWRMANKMANGEKFAEKMTNRLPVTFYALFVIRPRFRISFHDIRECIEGNNAKLEVVNVLS